MDAGDAESVESQVALQVEQSQSVEWTQFIDLELPYVGPAGLEPVDVVEPRCQVQRDPLVPHLLVEGEPVVHDRQG